MSYLDEETQRCIVDRIDESDGTVFPSHAQTRRIREKAADGDPEAIEKVKEYDTKQERARAQARAYYQRQKLKKKSNTLYPTDTAA